ncbi:SSI family serine proteinase inhibitor [Streptomyces gamaensis]|uniref:SSI family serine proteinase inhibitor n=1 Tax=Streptomyces gamaensis TaxID=1763542 RepID=A0ABW0YWD2_9ACTN
MPLRNLAAPALVTAALAPLLFAAPGATASAHPPKDPAGGHLTVTVTDAGRLDGRHELRCHPAGGDHPRARAACEQLDSQTRWDRDLFAPVAKGTPCTMIYGGPERARVTGSWAGRPVDAVFKRTDGCEIDRWKRFSALLGDPGRAPAPVPGDTPRG